MPVCTFIAVNSTGWQLVEAAGGLVPHGWVIGPRQNYTLFYLVVILNLAGRVILTGPMTRLVSTDSLASSRMRVGGSESITKTRQGLHSLM